MASWHALGDKQIIFVPTCYFSHLSIQTKIHYLLLSLLIGLNSDETRINYKPIENLMQNGFAESGSTKENLQKVC